MITNPEIVKELKRIAAANGGELLPANVVAAASNPESALHSQFDWDDSTAAQKYRLHQARNLIRVVVSYVSAGDGTEVPCRVFVSLTPNREDNTGYRVTTDVMSDAAMRAQLLADAKDDMKRFAAKYRRLTELADVFDAIEDALASTPHTELAASL